MGIAGPGTSKPGVPGKPPLEGGMGPTLPGFNDGVPIAGEYMLGVLPCIHVGVPSSGEACMYGDGCEYAPPLSARHTMQVSV